MRISVVVCSFMNALSQERKKKEGSKSMWPTEGDGNEEKKRESRQRETETKRKKESRNKDHEVEMNKESRISKQRACAPLLHCL